MNSRSSAFFLICLALFVLSAGVSYHRFMIAGDYTVEYEGECDPATETCFIGCEDEECSEVYYYTIVEKHASDVHGQCGPDITECEEASMCLPNDTACSITYCSPEELGEGEACEDLDESNVPDESSEDESADGEESGEESATEAEILPL